MKTTINVNYKGEAYPSFDNTLEKVAKNYRGESGDSGYSFFDNTRDIEFTFKTAKGATRFKNHAKRFKCVKKVKLVLVEE